MSEARRNAESPARILVADDDPDVLEAVRDLLQPHWKVALARSGTEALAVAEATSPDLVLTDVMMPGLDGFELIDRLRRDERTRRIPVMMLSARTGEDARVEGLEAGAEDYLVKPFSGRELVARVRTHLELARLRDRIARQREDLYSLLMQAPVPLYVVRGDELLLETANQLALAVWGSDVRMGRPLAEEVPQLRERGVDLLLREVVGSARTLVARDVRFTARHTGGAAEETYWTYTCAPLMLADGIPRAMVVCSDVTEQVAARCALQESEERFRAIFETAEVSIWEEDCSKLKELAERLAREHGSGLRDFLESSPSVLAHAASLVRVRDVNPATLRMFGATSKEELTRSVQAVLLPESLRGFIEEIIAIAEGQRVVSIEVPLQTLQGQRLSVQFTKGLPPPDHPYDRVLATLTDISGSTAPREARLAEMERAVKFSEMLTGIVGHDLRSPLSAIMMAAQLLESRGDPGIAGPAGRILSSARRMERMISQLLDFTRIRLGRGLPLEHSEVDLADLCRVVVEEAPVATCRDIQLVAFGDCRGTWDRDRLWQLVSNLVTNACEHGEPGAPVRVQVDGSRPDAVALEVSNRGEIPPELLPILFEPLHNRRTARKGSTSGLGLGLYISQQIVLSHGGTIRVGSEARQGTRFTVSLPRHPQGRKAEVFAGAGR